LRGNLDRLRLILRRRRLRVVLARRRWLPRKGLELLHDWLVLLRRRRLLGRLRRRQILVHVARNLPLRLVGRLRRRHRLVLQWRRGVLDGRLHRLLIVGWLRLLHQLRLVLVLVVHVGVTIASEKLVLCPCRNSFIYQVIGRSPVLPLVAERGGGESGAFRSWLDFPTCPGQYLTIYFW
jgi:hypothetical protein